MYWKHHTPYASVACLIYGPWRAEQLDGMKDYASKKAISKSKKKQVSYEIQFKTEHNIQ